MRKIFGILAQIFGLVSLARGKGGRGGGGRSSGSRPSSGSRSHAATAPHQQPAANSQLHPANGLNPNPSFSFPQPNAVGGPRAYPTNYNGIPMQSPPQRKSSNALPFGTGAVVGGIVGSRLGRGSRGQTHYGSTHGNGSHHPSERDTTTGIEEASSIQSDPSFNPAICSDATADDQLRCDALKAVIEGLSTSSTVQIVNQTYVVNSTNVE